MEPEVYMIIASSCGFGATPSVIKIIFINGLVDDTLSLVTFNLSLHLRRSIVNKTSKILKHLRTVYQQKSRRMRPSERILSVFILN